MKESMRSACAVALMVAAAPLAAGAQESTIRLEPLEVRAPHVFHPPKYLSTPLPTYPPVARAQRLEGAGVFDVRVMRDGRVGEVKVKQSTGVPILDEAAERTIRSWTFEPGRRGPSPVESWAEVPVRFSLTEK
jgi:TonB family protein